MGNDRRSDSIDYYRDLYKKAVLQKYGLTEEQFDSSMVYYYTHADRFEAIYKRVASRLEDRALALGATEGEIGKFSTLNTTGDTANIWSDRTRVALMPTPPYNRWEFELEVDSTFSRGDSFLLQFVCDYLYQDGSKNGVVYFVVGYENDTIITRNLHFLSSGISQVNFPAYDDSDIKFIRGFFYLGDGNNRSTTIRLLFLSNIQLIRFHKKVKEDEKNEKDSLSQDSILGERLVVDTISIGDSVGRGDALLPVDSGASTDGVATRRRVREP